MTQGRQCQAGSVAGVALVLLSACAAPPKPAPAPAPPLPVATAPDAARIDVLPPLGARYAGTLPMLQKAIPLPSGTWRVMARQTNAFTGYPGGATVVLARAEGQRLTGVLEIAGNTASEPATSGWPLNPVCQAVRAGGAALLGGDAPAATAGGNQDCVALTSQRSAAWRAPDAAARMRSLSRSLARLRLNPAPTLLLVAFGQTDTHSRLAATLWLTPSAGADDRQQDVDRILAWAQGWRGVMRRALSPGAAAAPAGVAEIR